MFGIAEKVKTFLIDSMQTCKVELSSSGERLEALERHFPGLFVLFIIPLALVLRQSTAGYDLAKEFKVNRLLFMDYLKL